MQVIKTFCKVSSADAVVGVETRAGHCLADMDVIKYQTVLIMQNGCF